jgi:hypothetical protein
MIIQKILSFLLLICLFNTSCYLTRSDKQNYERLLKKNPDWIKEQIKHDTITIYFNKIDTVKSVALAIDTLEIDSLRKLISTYSKDTVFINKVNTLYKYAKNPLCIKDTIQYKTDSVNLKIWQDSKGITYSLVINKQAIKVVYKTITKQIEPKDDKENYKYYAILLLLIIILLLYILLKK